MRYDLIWNLALPYQNIRDDNEIRGHAKVTFDFAKLLLKTEKGDPDIVIPAIILHDIGYSQLKKGRWKELFKDDADKKFKVRREHEIAGAKLAEEILLKINYPKDKIDEITEIISQHDTRKGWLNLNDGIVRDADRLWRFSKEGLNADLRRSDKTKQEIINKRKGQLTSKTFFKTKTSKKIAKKLLEKMEKSIS